MELPITGYVDRFSRRPGERVRAHVSVRDGGSYRVRLVRVRSADSNPRGPGVQFEDLGCHLDENHTGERYAVRLGSYADAPAPALGKAGSYTWTALIRPGLPVERHQAVLSHEHENARITLSLVGFTLRAEVMTVRGEVRCDLVSAVRAHRWYRVWVSVDEGGASLLVGAQSTTTPAVSANIRRFSVPELRLPGAGRFLVAARNAGAAQDHFDGRIEDPALLDGWWDSWPEPLVALSTVSAKIRAAWDYSLQIPAQTVIDVGPHALHGKLRNVPTRAVQGARWSGDELRWTQRPREYAAIHFHSDDLGDCEWPPAFEFEVPQQLHSGAYAFHLSCAAGEDWIPFYVLPPRAGPHAPIVFLAPTFTYQAYANSASSQFDDEVRERVRKWGAYPYLPNDYSTYGRSTYNKHPDGSGIAYSTRLRPMLSMRPAAISARDSRGSGLRHYPADMLLLAWLEHCGFAFDVVTDEDLHEQGASLLSPYAVVLTGTHPEYHTTCSLNALRDYMRSGGRLIYVGGNGFYWRIGRNEDLPEVIEVRRAEGGIRAWAAEPGEYYHSSDGMYGGLWRRNGRDPQMLVGVGFSAQGPFEATHYVRTPESHDARFAWMFEGIDGDILGDYGLSAGGAAGYELDRADVMLGTAYDAVILARSAPLSSSFYPPLEEILYGSTTVSGEPTSSLLRGDMVHFKTAAGGEVFSVGSITFCGSLWRNGFEGPVSQLLENVVRKFAVVRMSAEGVHDEEVEAPLRRRVPR